MEIPLMDKKSGDSKINIISLSRMSDSSRRKAKNGRFTVRGYMINHKQVLA